MFVVHRRILQCFGKVAVFWCCLVHFDAHKSFRCKMVSKEIARVKKTTHEVVLQPSVQCTVDDKTRSFVIEIADPSSG